jgi:hypothetical protein
MRRAAARNQKKFELLSCALGLVLGVMLGALSMGIAHPPISAKAQAAPAATHSAAARAARNSMLVP